MRVPTNVDTTVNAYLAFRATLRAGTYNLAVFQESVDHMTNVWAVREHNATAQERGVQPIKSILCPGLCTYIGMMPFEKCAIQVCVLFCNLN